MDNSEIKLLLECYRPQDAGDPIFADALRAVADDPELAAWFEERQRFDAVMFGKFREVPVPADLPSQIVDGYQSAAPAPSRRPRFWMLAGSVAALFLVGLLSWHFFAPRPSPSQLLAQQAIDFTGKMPALQFVCFDASAVAGWVNKQPGAQKVGLKLPKPADSMSMAMIGSSVVDWNGRPVVMVCLQNGQRMAMLYILSAEDVGDMLDGTSETVQKADWVVRTTKSGGQVRLLTAKGRPEDLNFPMPF